MNPQEAPQTPAPEQTVDAVPATPVAPQQSATPAPAAGTQDPGKGLATAAIICAIFVPIVGIILAFLSRSKSKEAGFKPSGLTTAAVVVSIIIIVLTAVLFNL